MEFPQQAHSTTMVLQHLEVPVRFPAIGMFRHSEQHILTEVKDDYDIHRDNHRLEGQQD